MKKYLLLVIVGLLFVSCKSRKVLTNHVDSTSTTTIRKTAHISENNIDTSKSVTQKQILIQDRSGYKIVITPVPGKPIHLQPNGTFSGEASKIEITGKKHYVAKQTENIYNKAGISNHKTVDSSGISKHEVKLNKKLKMTEAKPDYSWIWWVGGFIVGALIIYCLYKKFIF